MSIDQALDQSAKHLVERGLATAERGVTEAFLRKADARLGRPIPDELRAFYRRVTPVPSCPPPEYGLIGFQPVDDNDLTWLDDPQLREEKVGWLIPESCRPDGWDAAKLLIIGYTPFGDWLMWCDGLSGRPSGTIVVTDHESDEGLLVLGDSFAQWLGRYQTYGLAECAIAPATLDDLDKQLALAFLTDHVRLNPSCDWAKKKLRKIEKAR